ncbi:phage antirepressor [Rhodococcus hoagii]|nr:phage antirepressor [Prescottella equi]
MNQSTDLVRIAVPGADAPIMAAMINSTPMVAVKPLCDAIGIDDRSQRRKLESKSWATGVIMTSVAADGKSRDMYMVDRRTLTMWLATIDESRVGEQSRSMLVAFQAEAADALDRYFHEGGAINPRATEHQVNALIFQSRARMELLQAAKGLIRDEHLEAKARVVLAAGLGDVPELESGNKALLYTSDFLKGKNLTDKQTKSIASVFGKRVKAAYIETHGVEPGMYPMNLPNGQTRDVRAYTEADRPLLEQVWREHYAEKVAA